jgi:predicted metal-dependent phosphotriesterase family hydrolase
MTNGLTPAAMTVLGPVPATELGVTDAHDHLFIRTPALAGQGFEDLDLSSREVEEGRSTGIRTIVEMTPIGCGRRPDLLRALSERTAVHVVGATGYHRDAHYPAGHWVYDASVEQLAEPILADLREGMHPADWLDRGLPLDAAKAGVIKAGASYQRITAAERRRLVAAAIGSNETGAAVLVHLEVGTCGQDVVDLLTSEGVSPDRIILAHLDRNPDLELHVEIAARGVWLEYDTIGRIKYRPESVLLDLIEGVAAAGHIGRLLLGLDLGMRDYLRAYGGGPGLAYLMEGFVPRLRRRIGDDGVDAILRRNAAAAFAMDE